MAINVKKITPVLNVSNMAESFEWFEKLGWERPFAWNDGGMIGEGDDAQASNKHGDAGFGGVCSGEASLFLCVDGQGQRGNRGPGESHLDGMWMTWWLDSKSEVDAVHAVAVKHNMIVTHPPTDEPWGVHEFHLRHPDGHMFRVSCGLDQ